MAAVSSSASLPSVTDQHNSSVGAYKDISTTEVQLEKELKGTGKFAAASYPQ